MTVGSVRGNDRFETPVRVAQDGRSTEAEGVADVVLKAEDMLAASRGGHVRLKPAWTERVGCPHCAQKGFRTFQSMTLRASA